LYVSGKYFEASIEYERLVFKTENQADLKYNKYKKALCYKQLKNFSQAIEELQSIYILNRNDSLFQRICYQQALCLYLNEEPTKALWKIDEYLNQNSDTASYRILLPLMILCQNETFQWKEAQESLLRYIRMLNLNPEKLETMQTVVNELYQKKNLPRIRSIKKAENLSRFIPGAGQIYAGKPMEGIVNFLINASLLAFTAQQAVSGFYITGYLAGLGFFNKTYHGGMRRSENLAIWKNKELTVNFNSKINEILRSTLN
jgi:TM2 domain-containing membrane protein YozV